MDEYLILAVSADVWINDKGESFDCRYIVVKKDSNVKPMVFKTDEKAFHSAKKLIGKKTFMSFNERGKITAVNPSTLDDVLNDKS